MYIQGETFINLSYLTINANSILQYYQDNMLFDLITAGLLTNELLREYSHIVTDQMRAINLLYRHFLPPTLLAPQYPPRSTVLFAILNRLSTGQITQYCL